MRCGNSYGPERLVGHCLDCEDGGGLDGGELEGGELEGGGLAAGGFDGGGLAGGGFVDGGGELLGLQLSAARVILTQIVSAGFV